MPGGKLLKPCLALPSLLEEGQGAHGIAPFFDAAADGDAKGTSHPRNHQEADDRELLLHPPELDKEPDPNEGQASIDVVPSNGQALVKPLTQAVSLGRMEHSAFRLSHLHAKHRCSKGERRTAVELVLKQLLQPQNPPVPTTHWSLPKAKPVLYSPGAAEKSPYPPPQSPGARSYCHVASAACRCSGRPTGTGGSSGLSR